MLLAPCAEETNATGSEVGVGELIYALSVFHFVVYPLGSVVDQGIKRFRPHLWVQMDFSDVTVPPDCDGTLHLR